MTTFSKLKACSMRMAAFGLLWWAAGAFAQAPSQTYGCFAPPGQTQSPYNGVWVPPPGAAGYNPGVNYCVPNFSVSPPLRKFVDRLPGVGYANRNDLGQYIPLAKSANLATFSGDDYYEIGLRQYNEQMHSDLPGPNSTAAVSGAAYGTKLRGYYQKAGPGQTRCDFATTFPDTSPCVDESSHYLGPMILAFRDKPVRLKFYNELLLSNHASGQGYLPLPIDYNLMGAGMGRMDRSTAAACDPMTSNNCALYSDNRAVIHMHGGLTPWISDGTPHQWITPAGEPTLYTKGDSFQNVPDMVVTNAAAAQPGQFVPSPGDGIGTYYYTNRQSGRLLFYHDHSLGQTRLNVYAGMAAPYLIVDQVLEDAMIAAGILPDQSNLTPPPPASPAMKGTLTDYAVYKYGIPLVIQDKSFVNGDVNGQDHQGNAVDTVAVGGGMPMPATKDADPLWFNHPQDMSNAKILVNNGASSIYPEWFGNPGKIVNGKPVRSPNHGDLWLPHEYLPNEDPFNTWFDPATQTYGANPMGRWDYSPWMNPPAIPMVDTLPSPSVIPETYGDTMVVNGTVFPYLSLRPGAARFRVLNASNDRFVNLQVYYASTKDGVVCDGQTYTGSLAACTEVSMVPAINYAGFQGLTVTVGGGVGSIKVTNRGRGYNPASPPTVTLNGGGFTRRATAVPVLGTGAKAGQVVAIQITDFGSGYTSAPTISITAPPLATAAWDAATAYAINDKVLVSGQSYVAIVPNTNVQPPNSAYWALTAQAVATSYLMKQTTVDTAQWPASWPTDGRAGGVPYWAHSGPAIHQIGNEAGFLAQVATWPSQPVDFDHNTRSVTLNGVTSRSLMLPSAVRADVVIDFSTVAPNSALILYNDAPAPMPLWDNRNDYYTGNDDQSDAGGAPSTEAGYGPNTRTVMQFRVEGAAVTPSNAFTVTKLVNNLPAKYAISQKPPLVPQSFYPQTSGAKNLFANIADESLNVSGAKAPIGAVVVTLPGQSYSVPPTVKFSGGNCTVGNTSTLGFPVARANLNGVTGINLTVAGSGYATAPAVTIAASPAGAAATAKAVSVISGGAVIGIYVTDPGYGYLVAPAVTIAAPPAGAGNVTATATANVVTGSVGRITLDAATVGNYLCDSAPLVTLTTSKGNPGTGATAASTLVGARVLDGKNLVEGFDREYGRMDAILGSTPNPLTPWVGAGPVVGAAFYVDPPTELLVGNTDYLWRLMHIGVDSHAAHFHLFDVQVVNRVDWTGVIKPPSADELGWKETVRTNPFEDIILALRPSAADMQLPFTIPNSMRLLDPTVPLGSSGIFTPVAPPPGIAAVAQTTNVVNNYYWEYVWHCHLLGHEENDMMRPIVFRPEMATGGVSTQALNFGNVAVGTNSAMQTVTLTNSGVSPLTISSIGFTTSTITGNDFRLYTTNAGVLTPGTCFTVAGNVATPVATVAAGGNCTINVMFSPSTALSITGGLVITDNSMGRANSQQVVQLTGAGTSALITVSPGTLDFGSVNVNTTSAAQTVQVTNGGNAALRISALTTAAPFAVSTGTNACATNANIAAGASCFVYLTYRPTAATPTTPDAGTLTITSNAAGSPSTTISLTGTGAAVAIPTLSISSLNFGQNKLNTTPATQTVTVTNTGGAGTTLTLNTANFAITAPYTITPSGTCTVQQGAPGCTYTIGLPSSAAGSYPGTLTIASGDTAAGTTYSNPVALSGSFSAPALTTTATTLTFGSATAPVNVGSVSTSTVTLRNNVTAVPVVVTSVGPLSAPYAVTGTTCTGATLNAATPTCTITVTYSPTAAPGVAGTADTATLTVVDDANSTATAASHTVAAFNGYAAAPLASATLSPGSLAFGSVTRNTVSPIQYITMKNNGTTPFAVTTVASSSARYQVASNTCGTSLAAGASCQIGVQFAPTAAGAVTGRITVNNSATLRVTLTGSGL